MGLLESPVTLAVGWVAGLAGGTSRVVFCPELTSSKLLLRVFDGWRPSSPLVRDLDDTGLTVEPTRVLKTYGFGVAWCTEWLS